jgi:Sulfatase
MKCSHIVSMTMVAFGAMVGWSAASGRLDLRVGLVAAHQASSDDQAARPTEPTTCEPGSAKAVAILTAHNSEVAANVQKDGKKPNIVVIMADDVGTWNISAYHRGMMGGRTPNIDRIAREGALFTDYYAQQSCTAGRAAFISQAGGSFGIEKALKMIEAGSSGGGK